MGRPSKLSEHQWGELLRRLITGEKAGDLAKAFGVSPGTVSKRISQQAKISKSLANSLVCVESKIDVLPVSQQMAIRSLADQMKLVSLSLAEAAVHGAATASRLSQLAALKAEDLDLALVEEGEGGALKGLRTIAALSATSNESSKIAMGLLNVNRDKADSTSTLEDLILGKAATP